MTRGVDATAGVGQLLAHEAITRRVYEYAWGIDTRDWELYRSIFADDIVTDFSSYNGSGGPIEQTADEWVARVRPLFTGLDATQHTMSNPLVDLAPNGDTARCRMYMQAVHRLEDQPEPEFTIGGYYDNQLVKQGASDDEHQWLITSVALTVLWRRGNPAIMPIAVERGIAPM